MKYKNEFIKYQEQTINTMTIEHFVNYHINPDNRLIKACELGYLDVINSLFFYEIDIDDNVSWSACFRKCCKNGHINIVKKLYSLKGNEFELETGFLEACKKGHMNIIKFLFPLINLDDDFYFMLLQVICMNDQVEVVTYIHNLKKDFDLSKNNDLLFRISCAHGSLKIIWWLFVINKDLNIRSNNDEGFISACQNGHRDVIHFFAKYFKRYYYVHFKGNKLIYRIKEMCPICFDCGIEVKTSCGHFFCNDCINHWIDRNNKNCPICRQIIAQ